MEFIKKNIWLVIGGALGLVLLIVACVYLFLHIRQYVADTASADEQQDRLVQLEGRKPGPTEENVRLVSDNAVVLETYLKKITEVLQRNQVEPRKITQPVDFNSFLRATIDYMNEAVKKQGLLLPAKFDYGFRTYYSEGQLPAVGDVPRLTAQVQLVRALVDVLRKSKVAEISVIERQVFEKGSTPATADGEGRGRDSATLATALYPLDPPDAQGLYTREHVMLTLRIRDEFLAGLLNALACGGTADSARLFAVVTHVNIEGVGLPKSVAAEAGAAVAPPDGVAVSNAEKPPEQKKREERIVAGIENATVQLGVDVYRFANENREKAKP